MTEEKTMRLNQAAKTLNIGISSVVEFLTLKGFEIENKPTAKITQEQFKLLLKAFESSVADKLEALEKVKKAPELEVKKAKEAEPEISAKPAAPAKPVAETPASPAPEPAPAPSAETKPAAPAKTEEEAPATGVKLPGIKVLGKIDLDAKGKPAAPKAAEAPKATETPKPAEAKTPDPAPAPKTEAPAPAVEKPAETPKAEMPKVETPKVETPKPEAPKAEPVQPVAAAPKQPDAPKTEAPKAETPKAENPKPETPKTEAPQVQPAKPAAAAPVTPAAPATPTPPAAPVTPAADAVETIAAKGDQLKGLTVLGKIELPKDSFRKKGGKPVASSDNKNRPGQPGQGGDKKKRKRIITQAPTTNVPGDRPQGGGGQGQGQGGQRPGGGGGQGRPGDRNRPGQGNQRPIQAANPKPEVTDKQIQEQIKATLARLSGGKGGNQGNRSKYRREKRSAIADATEAQRMQEQSESKTLKLTEFISANDLASLMNVSVNEVIKVCLGLGMFVSINQRLDAEAITIITDEFGYDVEFLSAEEEESILEEEDPESLQDRAPIVTIMGHVDHGKTSLLDYIRNSRVASGEAGGITQHIGAYDVLTETGKRITFLDTPGHEAFTAMRARGAKVTDVVIIVVAADDDVMPQTKEALNHAQAAGSPIVIAINKIDKPAANPDRIREQLAAMNVLVEEWGGKYQCQEISAKSGQGIPDLLEKVLLEAEILELKANPNRKALGTVIEASLDKGRGYVTTVLVQTGTLKVGDIVLAGSHFGRVKAMTDHRGRKMKEAIPSTPVQVLGLDGAPQAGDKLQVMETEREARELATNRTQLLREQSMRTKKHITLDEIGRRLAIGSFKELNVIVKGDVDGSVEALSDSLLKLSTPEVQVNILNKGVGQISESDVLLASASDAIIIGFQVRPSLNARKLAEQEQIDIRLYSIIYNAINELKDAMEGMLAPTVQEVIVANVEVREVFKITKVGTIAGCMVTDGTITRNSKIRIIRDGIVVHSGDILALKRFKDDVAEVRTGFECGISIKKFDDLVVGDIIEAYTEKEVKRTL
ncbi:translation initiation factor IF-2 [Adhaeribacter sp. BT258]|uniref:Translation initiation factor IF-2 n=1 Tax=Adhaeribacter terrigena TaxID=2793070 RepID=A0ABS1BXI5_9BACT|nr:translation initiation factor IF-2 [Adhaeribacter terrigena]MBK0401602.1 translation initiation factor IF-2 [Adhaeribacter terrigena]